MSSEERIIHLPGDAQAHHVMGSPYLTLRIDDTLPGEAGVQSSVQSVLKELGLIDEKQDFLLGKCARFEKNEDLGLSTPKCWVSAHYEGLFHANALIRDVDVSGYVIMNSDALLADGARQQMQSMLALDNVYITLTAEGIQHIDARFRD